MERPVADPHGRPLRNLRISVNKECNLRCTYCHLEGGAMAGGDIRPEEFGRLVRLAARLGVDSVKITGGEPTLRSDLEDIIRAIRPHVREVSMTTNGLLMVRRAEGLREAGLDRVNISIDTLDPERYAEVTQGGRVERAMAGIEASVKAGLTPVKLNMVVLRGFNVADVDAMRAYARTAGARLQLIELHTDRENAWGLSFRSSFHSLGPVEAGLGQEASFIETAPQHGRKRYHLSHADDRDRLAEDVVEVVRPYANPGFCADCHRLRVTGDGNLKPCLMRSDNHVDFLAAMRAGADDDVIVDALLEANRRRAPYWTGPLERPGSLLGRPLPVFDP